MFVSMHLLFYHVFFRVTDFLPVFSFVTYWPSFPFSSRHLHALIPILYFVFPADADFNFSPKAALPFFALLLRILSLFPSVCQAVLYFICRMYFERLFRITYDLKLFCLLDIFKYGILVQGDGLPRTTKFTPIDIFVFSMTAL